MHSWTFWKAYVTACKLMYSFALHLFPVLHCLVLSCTVLSFCSFSTLSTDGQTDRRTDGHTDIRTCWAASSQLKTSWSWSRTHSLCWTSLWSRWPCRGSSPRCPPGSGGSMRLRPSTESRWPWNIQIFYCIQYFCEHCFQKWGRRQPSSFLKSGMWNVSDDIFLHCSQVGRDRTTTK